MSGLATQKGIQIIGFHGIGPQSFLTNFPVTKLADIQGKKFRVIPSPPRVGSYKDWGAVARPMELGEVYTALQQRTLDGMENPPDVIYKMKLHEAAKYYTITEHFAFVSNIIVSKKWYDSLTPDLREVVSRSGRETIAWADVAFTKSQNESLEAMRKAAVVTNMPPAELEKMKDLTRKGVWEAMKADPQRGPIVKLLSEDVAKFQQKK
jgi:TRAP-type C4-dicarboxylate transport system substrate-binding protein